MISRAKYAAMVGLFLGLFCGLIFAGCNRSPSASVSPDCQKFLDNYFDALKSKDIGKLQELSGAFISSLSSAASVAGAPASAVDMAREDSKKMVADAYGKLYDKFGDFKSYSVISEKETTIPSAAPEAPQMMKAGTHAVMVCNAKFSKNSGSIQLNLYKEQQNSDYSIEAWHYEGQP